MFLADDYKEDKKKKRQNQIERPPLNSQKEDWRNVHIQSTEAKILRQKPLSGTQEGERVQVPRKGFVIPWERFCYSLPPFMSWSGHCEGMIRQNLNTSNQMNRQGEYFEHASFLKAMRTKKWKLTCE